MVLKKKDGWFEIEKNKPLLDALEKEGVPRYPEILAPDGKVDAKKYMALFKIGAIGDVDHIFVVRKDDLPANKGEWPKSKEELDEANIPYVMCYQIGKEYHVFT